MLDLVLLVLAFVSFCYFCYVVFHGWRIGFGRLEWASAIFTCLAMVFTGYVGGRALHIGLSQSADLVPIEYSTIYPWQTATFIGLGVTFAGALSLFLG